ncbi:MAG: glycosyltransferase 61 family protein [Cyanobacteriota bacterium]|nr:glycosyltransferase 61 family protein [Cyanobacteriota bacterium]
MHPLARIPRHHPALWGRLEVHDPSPLLEVSGATVVPSMPVHGIAQWWRRHGYGVFDSQGRHVESLSDWRGERRICWPVAPLEAHHLECRAVLDRDTLFYGGTLYDHFGHLIMETARVYQLLRFHRQDQEKHPIWFHDATPHRGCTLKLDMVQRWFHCLGIGRRVRLVQRPIRARRLLSSPSLYQDRRWISQDLFPACQAALKPRLRDRLARRPARERRLAYLSRHRLAAGSNQFDGEAALVAQLEALPHVDVICPEELDVIEKIALYRRYDFVCGFPQSCMNLKLFTPGDHRAHQVLFIAGEKSLSSSWVNIDRATGFGDSTVDCRLSEETLIEPSGPGSPPWRPTDGAFQRVQAFDTNAVLQTIKVLTQ